MRAALLVLVIVAGCGATRPACPVYEPSPIARPFVWRVSGPHGSLLIQATHQGAGPDDVSPAAWSALDQAQLFIAEADEAVEHQEGDPGEPQPLFHLPPGESLRRLVSDDDFEALRERIGISPDELARLKPWVAFMLLGRSQVKFEEPSINAGLLEHARSRRLAVMFLETWEEQASYLDAAITPAKLSLAVQDAPNISCRLDRRLGAFRAGDDAVFANDVAAGEPVVARIERWHMRLREVVDSGQRAFVAVGIGQVVGPYGLLARFAANGYQVQKL